MGTIAAEETTLPEAGLELDLEREEASLLERLLDGGPTDRPPPMGSPMGRETGSLLDELDLPSLSAEVQLASGRRCSLEARPDGDRLTVRARDGKVMLRVTLTDAGPVLVFEAADVELRGTRTLRLASEAMEVRAGSLRLDSDAMEVSTGSLRTHVGGDVATRVTGARHTRIDGADRLEAGTLQAQANKGAAELRAAGRIALDGEHIGLNDDPCPVPFSWSAIAEEKTNR